MEYGNIYAMKWKGICTLRFNVVVGVNGVTGVYWLEAQDRYPTPVIYFKMYLVYNAIKGWIAAGSLCSFITYWCSAANEVLRRDHESPPRVLPNLSGFKRASGFPLKKAQNADYSLKMKRWKNAEARRKEEADTSGATFVSVINEFHMLR